MEGNDLVGPEQINELLTSLIELESLGDQIRRKNIDYNLYLTLRNAENGTFPQFRVRVQNGDEVQEHFVFNDEDLRVLREKYEADTGKTVELIPDTPTAVIDSTNPEILQMLLLEIFSAGALADLIKKIEGLGLPDPVFNTAAQPVYQMRQVNKQSDDEGDDGLGDAVALRSLNEVLDQVREHGKKGVNIQRYKGLGEMNPEQLWETTMDPEKRVLIKVVLEDVVRADEIFSILMGDEVAPRRSFIENNALNVRNLDI